MLSSNDSAVTPNSVTAEVVIENDDGKRCMLFRNMLQTCSIMFIDLVLMGFEQAEYTVSEGGGSITLCVDLASPIIQRSSVVTFQTSSLSASGKMIFSYRSLKCWLFCLIMAINLYGSWR